MSYENDTYNTIRRITNNTYGLIRSWLWLNISFILLVIGSLASILIFSSYVGKIYMVSICGIREHCLSFAALKVSKDLWIYGTSKHFHNSFVDILEIYLLTVFCLLLTPAFKDRNQWENYFINQLTNFSFPPSISFSSN